MIRFKIKAERDLKDFQKDLRTWKGKLKDLRWAWPQVFRAIEAHHLAVFAGEGADNEAGNGVWKPLHETTIRARLYGFKVGTSPPYDYLPDSQEGPEGKILHWSHRLVSSMGHGGGLFMGDAIRRMTKRGIEYGTQRPEAWRHQEGGVSEQGWKLPRRPFLDYEGGPNIGILVLEEQIHKMMGAR